MRLHLRSSRCTCMSCSARGSVTTFWCKALQYGQQPPSHRLQPAQASLWLPSRLLGSSPCAALHTWQTSAELHQTVCGAAQRGCCKQCTPTAGQRHSRAHDVVCSDASSSAAAPSAAAAAAFFLAVFFLGFFLYLRLVASSFLTSSSSTCAPGSGGQREWCRGGGSQPGLLRGRVQLGVKTMHTQP